MPRKRTKPDGSTGLQGNAKVPLAGTPYTAVPKNPSLGTPYTAVPKTPSLGTPYKAVLKIKRQRRRGR